MNVEFIEGQAYATRSICDHDCIIRMTVVKRTDKTIVTDKGKRLRISVYEGREQVKPWGSYSMAPIIDANDTRELF